MYNVGIQNLLFVRGVQWAPLVGLEFQNPISTPLRVLVYIYTYLQASNDPCFYWSWDPFFGGLSFGPKIEDIDRFQV